MNGRPDQVRPTPLARILLTLAEANVDVFVRRSWFDDHVLNKGCLSPVMLDTDRKPHRILGPVPMGQLYALGSLSGHHDSPFPVRIGLGLAKHAIHRE